MLTLSPPEQLAWRGFLHAHDALWKALERGLEADGLNLPAYELLTTLEEAGEGGVRMSDLAARLLGPAHVRHGDLQAAGEVLARERLLALEQPGDLAAVDDATTVLAGGGTARARCCVSGCARWRLFVGTRATSVSARPNAATRAGRARPREKIDMGKSPSAGGRGRSGAY